MVCERVSNQRSPSGLDRLVANEFDLAFVLSYKKPCKSVLEGPLLLPSFPNLALTPEHRTHLVVLSVVSIKTHFFPIFLPFSL